MKKTSKLIALFSVCVSLLFLFGCDIDFSDDDDDDAEIRQVAREEALKVLDEYKQSFVPEKFGFGVPWEVDFNYAQGVKVGNLIFVAGQLSHNPEKDETWEYGKVTVGEDFEKQFRQTLENMKKVLEHYGASMDDVMFLQSFFDPEAGGKGIGNAGPVVRKLINEYFPKGHHAMTNMQVVNLFGQEQFVETNAIAVVRE